VGLWEQIRGAISAAWTDVQQPGVDARTQMVTLLTEAWQTEQRVARQIRQTIPEILYEHFRQHLEAMARDDERHAHLLQEHLGGLGTTAADRSQPHGGWAQNFPNGPWKRLRHIFAEKRELYEYYRQGASSTDDPGLQSLLQRLRDDEERHQDQLISMLMRLDAHVHETIT
jgi:rubrerythrin